MADVAQQAPSTPAPQAPAAPSTPQAPSSQSSFQQPAGAYSADEMFREFEAKLGLNRDEQAPDFTDARQWKDGTMDDLLQGMEHGDDVDPTTGEEPEDKQTQQPGEEDEYGLLPELDDAKKAADESEFSYDFEDEIGGKQHKIQFKSKEQLNTAIKKAVVADRLYKDNKALKEEIETFQEDRAFAKNMDDYLENRPFELMDMVMEDLDEEQAKDWLLKKAEWYGQDAEVRRQAQVQKENEMLRRKLQAIEQAETKALQNRNQIALEADRHVVQSWGAGVLTKMRARIPDAYHGIVEKELRSTLLEARHLQSQKQNVDVKTLDRIFSRNMRPLMELINEKTSKKMVDKEVGRVLTEKKQQNLTRVQAAATQAMSNRNQNSKFQKELEENPTKIFDHLIAGIDSGKYRMKA